MKAFLTGLGIGIGLGVLFAPNRGEETRNRVRDRVGDLSDFMSEQAENLKTTGQRAKAAVSKASEAFEGLGEGLSPKKDQASEMGNDLINTMSREELMRLNGIGPVLADKIIAHRPFSSRQELVECGILPQSTLEELDRELRTRERRSA